MYLFIALAVAAFSGWNSASIALVALGGLVTLVQILAID